MYVRIRIRIRIRISVPDQGSGSAREGDMGSEGPQFGACGSSHCLASIDKLLFSLHNLVLCNMMQSDSYSLSVKSVLIQIYVLILHPELEAAECFFGGGVGDFPAQLHYVV